MSNVVVLENNVSVLGRTFNIYGDFENPLFLATDVAEWIDYDKSSISKMLQVVSEEEKGKKNFPTLGGSQEKWFLTEDGLYELLMQSTKPVAKQFKSEVKKLLKGLRTKKLVVAELPDTDEQLLMYAQKTIKLVQEKQQLQAQLKQAIREKGQISNDREASVMGKLGAATKKINALEETVVVLEEEIKELKSEPDNTVVGFTLLHKLKVSKTDLSVYGRTLTKICKDKGISLKSIQMEGEKYPANVYPVSELIKFFTGLGFVL